MQLTLQATQLQTIDLVFFTSFVEASFRGDKKLADFALMRFRPEARKAVDAWLRTDPFNNPNAPIRPFAMAEYTPPEREAAKRADEEHARMLAAAQQASRASDEYVLLTVRFAAVLFFGGIVSTFESRRLRTSVFLLAWRSLHCRLLSWLRCPSAENKHVCPACRFTLLLMSKRGVVG